MFFDKRLQTCLRISIHGSKRFRGNEIRVEVFAGDKCSIDIVDPREPSGHAGTKVHTGLAEHCNEAARHVLAAMIAHAFNDSSCAGVSYSETLACPARSKEFARRGSVQRDVSKDYMPSAVLRSQAA